TNSSGCQDTIIKQVVVSAKPLADFSADTACFNSPTQFTDLSTTIAPATIISYSWDFGDGLPGSTQQNPIHTYTNYGTFTVTLTVTNSNGCVSTKTKQVLVHPLPVAAFSFTSPICQGAVVSFNDLSSTLPGYTGQIVRWFWNFDDGTTQNILFPNNPDVDHVFAGTALSHNVRLTVITSDSCQSFIEHVVTSIPSPIANFSNPTTNCSDQLVPFTDQSQPNGGGNITSWYWDFGDPGSGMLNNSSAQNPSHEFSAPGPFTVVLIVTNASNCTDTVSKTLTIDSPPVASFIADTACLGNLTTFTNGSTTPPPGSIATYFWQFGDGQTSTSQNPTHLYSAAQVYNVTLTVTTTNGCVKDTTIQVLVTESATAAFSYQTPSCAGSSVQFTDQSVAPSGYITTWVWDFDDGNTVTVNYPASPDVTHIFATGGTYNVKLTVTTSKGCTNSKTNPVVIISNPLANFSFPGTNCALMGIQFNDNSQQNGGGNLMSWEWNFDDPGSGSSNSSNLQNPIHMFSDGGTFDVQLIVTNINGCKDTISQTVTVIEAPLATFSADTACFNSITQFTDASTAPQGTITTWNWNFGDPGSGSLNTSTLQNPTHIFSNTGNFNVTLQVTTSDGCQNDTVIQITVNPKPLAMFSASSSCVGTATQFTDLSTAPGSMLTSWLWDFGDGVGTSTVQNPTYTYTTWGTYNVKLIVTNLSNCTDSIIMPVTARPTPTADFTYTSFHCPAGQVNFQDLSHGNNAAIVDHYWIFEPGYTSDMVNPTYTYNITDTTYLVTLIVTDNYGCQDTIVNSVYVEPGMSFTFNYDTVCFGEVSHFSTQNLAAGDTLYSVHWDFGDPNSAPYNESYLYNPTHTFSAPNVYTVKLSAWNSDNCKDSIYKVVQVYDLPEPAFSFVSEPCDSIIHLNDETLPGIGNIQTWEWHFGDGSAPLIITGAPSGDTSHLYQTVGQFNVTLITTNSRGCLDSITQVVERYPCISASFDPDTTLMCANYPITFGDSSIPVNRIAQWNWNFDDGLDTTYTTYASSITHRFASAGTYHVRLLINATVNGVQFADSTIHLVMVHATPEAYFASPNTCLNQAVLFTDTSETFGEPNVLWSWNFGDPGSGTADTSSMTNPSHTYPLPGYYTAQMKVANQYGCEDSLAKQIRIFGLPEARFGNTVACEGDPTYFTDMSQTSDTTFGGWNWNFGVPSLVLDTSTLRNPSYIYPATGDFTVQLIVQDYNGCRDTVDSTVTVSTTPLSNFKIIDKIDNMTGKIQLKNESTGATGYWWDFGNGKTSEDANPTVTYTEDGTYTIMLVSMNDFGCLDTTYYEYDVLFKGLYIPNAFAPSSINLGVMLFKPVGMNLKKYHIQVFNVWGEMLWESTLLDSDGRPTEGWDGKYNGNLMPSGTYIWKVEASFIDDSQWDGNDIGKGDLETMGTVTLVR
ncbi:MAG TPA: PKD domain-containing protein, partial [Bacteroidales bacterium]|nr:PKD domain-containing protein [Bacteroidales bacterium]